MDDILPASYVVCCVVDSGGGVWVQAVVVNVDRVELFIRIVRFIRDDDLATQPREKVRLKIRHEILDVF